MLELKHVAVECIYPSYKDEFAYLEKHGIYTVQDFIEKYPTLPEEIKKYVTKEDSFKRIERCLRLLNREDRELDIKSLRQYSDPKLNKVDKYNMGKVLPIMHPLTGFYRTTEFATHNDMEHIKRYLGLIGTRGKNYLKERHYNIGDVRLELIAKAVDMYTWQVERQAKLMGYDLRKSPNVFRYQEKEKKELIKENYEDIIDYLISLETELWYGPMSPTHIDTLYKSVDGTRDSDKEVREKYTEYISNYTTLPELEEVSKGRCRALNVFMKPDIRSKK